MTIEQPPFVFVNHNQTGNARFYGFLIDLMEEIFEMLNKNLTYNLYLVPDNKFGTNNNGVWNGIIGELVNKNADFSLAPLTVSSSRAQVVEYSASFLDTGFKVLVKKPQSKSSNIFSFLSPLSWEIWFLLVVGYFVISLYTYLTDKFSPYGYSKQADEKDELSIRNVIIKCMESSMGGALLIGRSWSTILGNIGYASLIMIIMSSYTANLAASLTAKQTTPALSGLDDIRNKNSKFAMISSSSSTEWLDYNRMGKLIANQAVYYNNLGEAVKAVQNDEVDALIYDAATLDYISDQNPCETTTVGDLFNPQNLAFAFPQNSSLTQEITVALLQLRIQGVIDQLYKNWFVEIGTCNKGKDSNAVEAMTIFDLYGVFLLCVGFMIAGIVILIGENIMFFSSKKGIKKTNDQKVSGKVVKTVIKGVDTILGGVQVELKEVKSQKTTLEQPLL